MMAGPTRSFRVNFRVHWLLWIQTKEDTERSSLVYLVKTLTRDAEVLVKMQGGFRQATRNEVLPHSGLLPLVSVRVLLLQTTSDTCQGFANCRTPCPSYPVTLQVEHKVPELRHHAALHMKHRRSRVAKYEALEGGLVYTGWNMTCSPRSNRMYTARERAAGRRQGAGGTRLSRIQKSKNSGSWCAKAFYYTKYKYLVKNGGTSVKFWKGYFEKPGPQKTWLRDSLNKCRFFARF